MISAAGRRRAWWSRASRGSARRWLLSELRRRAEARGHLVLAGSAAEFERDLPFGVWVDALDAYVASQDLPAREDVDQDWLADLSGVLPSLRDVPRLRPALGDERHRAHRAVRALLDLIADDKPLVLVLDDLHWSDAASIEVLAALLRRGTGGRVLLALGYRSGKAPAKLSSALAAPAVTIIELGPLSEPECSQLAGEQLGAAEQLAAIYTQSGGNPFYTLQLARASALPSRSSTGDRLALDAGVPRVVAAALVEELEALTAEARRAPASRLRSPATRSSPSSRMRSRSCRRTPGSRRWTSCSTRACCMPTDVPRRFAFRHPLVRRAVYESSKGGWRLAAHAPRGAGAWPRRARRRRRAPITSSSPASGASRPRSSCCSRQATPTRPGRPRARRAGTRPRCG